MPARLGGRVYKVTCVAKDASGNQATSFATAKVPLSQSDHGDGHDEYEDHDGDHGDDNHNDNHHDDPHH